MSLSFFDNPITSSITTILGGAIKDRFGNKQDDRMNAAAIASAAQRTSRYQEQASLDVKKIVTSQSFAQPRITRPEQRRPITLDRYHKRMQQISYDHPYFVDWMRQAKATSSPIKKNIDNDVFTSTQFNALADTKEKPVPYNRG